MRVLAIGDIHGRDYWRTIPFNEFDRVIFVGDYLDSARLSNDAILGNLYDLIELQSKYSHIDFLIGNHDLQYLTGYAISGYRASYEEIAMELLLKLKWIYAREIDSVLYTHAGLLRNFFLTLPEPDLLSIEGTLNRLNEDHWEYLIETVGNSRGGSADSGSFIWNDFLDFQEEEDPLPVNQVFGHTANQGGKIMFINGYWRMCIDVLTKFKHAFEIVDGNVPAMYPL